MKIGRDTIWLKQGGKWPHRLAFIVLLWATLYLYAPAVGFGFIWDDPIWFGHAWGKSWWQTLLPNPDFQFYRPLTMLYFWLFLRVDGSFAAELLHWVQIGWHLLSVVLAYAIGRRLGFGRWPAWALAALLAVFPLAYQAVAWAAPQQPLVNVLQSGAWVAYLMGRQKAGYSNVAWRPFRVQYSVNSKQYSLFSKRYWLGGSLLLFVMALMVQESSVAVAFVPLLYEFLLHLKIDSRSRLREVLLAPMTTGWGWALAYPMVAFLFGVVWLIVPRQAGITGLTMQTETAAYLSQVLIYPLLGRPWGYAPDLALTQVGLLSGAGLGVAGLLALAWRNGRGRLALLALLWAVGSIVPLFVGLHFDYVKLAERLFYAPLLGVTLLWSAALWPRSGVGGWWRYAAMAVWLLIVAQSVWLLLLFGQMYRQGTAHLQTAIQEMSRQPGHYLFINFPDRYLLERPFYPSGLWGVTLAPVVVDLADFLPITTGHTAVSTSYSMPWLDAEARTDSPYTVDMRGVIIDPSHLYQQALTHDGVYLSRYEADGRFHLERAGHVQTGFDATCPLVRFDDIICLHEIQLEPQDNGVALSLTWSTAAAVPPHTTIFVHLGQPGTVPRFQADGDSWRGLLPLTDWQPGHLIHDERTLPFISDDEVMVLQIGIYNWVEGQRRPAVFIEEDGRERPLPDDAYLIDTIMHLSGPTP
jgi:hypothetical protein